MSKTICIYKITSPTGNIYIGQTWDFENRYKSNVSSRQRILHRSYEKYGADAHKKEIIIMFPDTATQPELDAAEIHYINFYREQGFTMMNIRDGGSKGKIAEESKLLISGKMKQHHADNPEKFKQARIRAALKNTGQKRTEETKLQQSESLKKHTRTLDHCLNISKSKRGVPSKKKGTKYTPEQIEVNRQAHIGVGLKAVLQCDKVGNVIKQWGSVKEAGETLGISRSFISGCLVKRKGYHTAGGFIWRYVE